MPSLYDKTLPVGASGVGLHLGGARWLLLPTRPKPDPATQQRQRTQLARSSTMLANQPMLHQSSAAAKSLRRNHLHATNVRGHRAVVWLCRAQRAVRLKPLRCTAFVRRHHWKRCSIDVAIIQQSTELVWPSQTNATEGYRIARPNCRRHPPSLQRSSCAKIRSPVHSSASEPQATNDSDNRVRAIDSAIRSRVFEHFGSSHCSSNCLQR